MLRKTPLARAAVLALVMFTFIFLCASKANAQIALTIEPQTGVVEGVAIPTATQLATFTIAGPQTISDTYTANIDWGDTSSFPGVVSFTGTTGMVAGGHTYVLAGTYHLTITVTDTTNNAFAGVAEGVAVADAPLSPVAATINLGDVTNPVTLPTEQIFTDENSYGAASNFAAQINYGDGFIGSGIVTGTGAGPYSISPTASHTYLQLGVQAGTYSIADVGGSVLTVNFTVNVQDSTTITIASGLNPSVYGQSVTLTALVAQATQSSGTPTGTVTFFNGSTNLGTPTLDATGQATLILTSLPAGTDTVTAVYNADPDHATSTSSALLQSVSLAATSTTVASGLNPSLPGQPVALTATVTNTSTAAGTPTGTVRFYSGSLLLGSVALDANSPDEATLTTTAMPAGPDSISAIYGGDSNFGGSTSTPISQTVTGPQYTTITITNVPVTSVIGQPVTLTSVVSNASVIPSPTGTVTFESQASGASSPTPIGTGMLNANGTATFTTTFLISGSPYTITASYGGDSSNESSATSAVTQSVVLAGTATTGSIAPSTVEVGQSTKLSATVTAAAPAVGTPTGTVSFYNGSVGVANLIGTATLSGGKATTSYQFPSAGKQSVVVQYSGDVNFLASSTTTSVAVTVNPGLTTTAVSSSPNPSGLGQSLTLTATIAPAPPASGQVTGTVSFYHGALTAADLIGTAPVSGNQATAATTNLPAGPVQIFAVYSGDVNFNTSTSAPFTQVVTPGAATATLTSSVNPSVVGQQYTLSADVTGTTIGLSNPTGTVTFYNGSNALGTTGLNPAGIATLITSDPVAGTLSLTATYNGNANYAPVTSSVLTQQVNNPTPSVTQLTPSSTVEGSEDTTIAIAGTGFMSSSVVEVNGATVSTTYVSSSQLTAVIPAADLTQTTGSSPLSIIVTNPMPGGGTSATGPASSFTVSGATLSATNPAIVSTSAQGVTTITANFADANASAPATEFSASIDWDDGTVSAGTITPNGDGSFTVTGTHTYADITAGYSTVVTITQVGGATVTATANLTITIPAGLSMIGLPYDYSHSTLAAATILGLSPDPNHDNRIDLITFDASTDSYEFDGNLPGANAVSPDLSGYQTIPGQGYWVLEPQLTAVTQAGAIIPSPFSTALEPGWNQISDPFTTAVPTPSLTFLASSTVDNVPANTTLTLQQALNGGLIASSFFGYDQSTNTYTVVTTLQPFVGYWVYVSPTVSGDASVTTTYTSPG